MNLEKESICYSCLGLIEGGCLAWNNHKKSCTSYFYYDPKKKDETIKCTSCGSWYKEDSITIERCEYCDKIYCTRCLPAHKRELHGGK